MRLQNYGTGGYTIFVIWLDLFEAVDKRKLSKLICEGGIGEMSRFRFDIKIVC